MVYFYTNSGTLSAVSATTTNGIATVNLILDDNMLGGTTAIVNAFIGLVNTNSDPAEVTCIEPIVTIYADDYIIVPVTGTSDITAIVTETDGTPIEGVIVIFFAKNDTGDDIGVLDPVYEITTSIGIADTGLTSLDTDDVVTVTAKCGSRVSNEITITTE